MNILVVFKHSPLNPRKAFLPLPASPASLRGCPDPSEWPAPGEQRLELMSFAFSHQDRTQQTRACLELVAWRRCWLSRGSLGEMRALRASPLPGVSQNEVWRLPASESPSVLGENADSQPLPRPADPVPFPCHLHIGVTEHRAPRSILTSLRPF